MSNCNCNDISTTPCTSGVGCSSTNYAKCIYYSGTTLTSCVSITNGDNLDTVISKLATAICNVTPSDLLWSSFDYDCLGPFSTAQAFAEGISAAHCTLDGRVAAVKAPVFTLCSLFTSGDYLITPGTTRLETILQYYGELLCALSTNNPATITVAENCFTSNTGIATLKDYLTWIVENTCSIKSNLTALITSNTNAIAAIQSYLGTAGTLASKHDMSCLSGGATETAYSSIELLRDAVCAINTTLSGYPDLNNVTLSWASCYAYGATASLSTQLGRIVSVLKLQKYTFSSDFTVTSGACGNTVALNASVGNFACSDLASCSLHNLGDVDPTLPTNSDCGKSLKWDSDLGYYRLIADSTFTNVGVQAKSGLYAAEPSGFLFKELTASLDCVDSTNYKVGFVEDAWLDLTPYLSPNYVVGLSTPYIKKGWDGNIYFKGHVVSSASTIAIGAAAQPYQNTSFVTIAALIPAAYRPSSDVYIDTLVAYPRNTGSLISYVPGILSITSGGSIFVKCFADDYVSVNFTGGGGANLYDGFHNLLLTGKAIYQ